MGDTECKYCPREFGNEGARANHERACDQRPDGDSSSSRQREPRDRGQDRRRERGRERRPAPREERRPAPREERGGAPAPAEQANAGSTLVDAAIAAFDDDLDTQTRANALRSGLGIVGDAFVRYNEYRERKMEEQDKRATNVELEEVTDYPECNECGYQFDGEDIGLTDEQVRCPGCDKLYEVRDAEPDEIERPPQDD